MSEELQGPETEELNRGEKFWAIVSSGEIFQSVWMDDLLDREWLHEGSIFKSKEAAEKWVKAKNEG